MARGIAAVEVAMWHRDPIWKPFAAPSSIVDHPVRIEVLFRHQPASTRQTSLRAELRQIQQRRSGPNPQRPGFAAASGLAQRGTPCAPHTNVSETRTVGTSNKEASSVRNEYAGHR
jgi:hypothetical protein